MKLLLGLLLALAINFAASEDLFLNYLNRLRQKVAKATNKELPNLVFDPELERQVRNTRCDRIRTESNHRWFLISTQSDRIRALNQKTINDFYAGRYPILDQMNYGLLEALAPGQTRVACVWKTCSFNWLGMDNYQAVCFVGPYNSLSNAMVNKAMINVDIPELPPHEPTGGDREVPGSGPKDGQRDGDFHGDKYDLPKNVPAIDAGVPVF